jgi:hypothetical protein
LTSVGALLIRGSLTEAPDFTSGKKKNGSPDQVYYRFSGFRDQPNLPNMTNVLNLREKWQAQNERRPAAAKRRGHQPLPAVFG